MIKIRGEDMSAESLSSYHLHVSARYSLAERAAANFDLHKRMEEDARYQLRETYEQLAEAGVVERVENFDALCQSGWDEVDGFVTVWNKAEVAALPPDGKPQAGVMPVTEEPVIGEIPV